MGAILLLIGASFAPDRWNLPPQTNGLICCGLLAVGLLFNLSKKKNISAVTGPLKSIDFETLGLLVGLFLMIGGIKHEGVIDAAADLLAKLGSGNLFLLYTVILWASVPSRKLHQSYQPGGFMPPGNGRGWNPSPTAGYDGAPM